MYQALVTLVPLTAVFLVKRFLLGAGSQPEQMEIVHHVLVLFDLYVPHNLLIACCNIYFRCRFRSRVVAVLWLFELTDWRVHQRCYNALYLIWSNINEYITLQSSLSLLPIISSAATLVRDPRIECINISAIARSCNHTHSPIVHSHSLYITTPTCFLVIELPFQRFSYNETN